MSNLRHRSAYQELEVAIGAAGGVECQEIPAIFWPEDYSDPQIRKAAIRTAKSICGRCPAKPQCFAYAVESDERWGIWAGTLPHER